jgi:ribosomal protein S18 acetylase RimI-like enzyme
MSAIQVQTVKDITSELVEAIGLLTAQLSSTAAAPSFNELAEIAASPATTLFVARVDERIVGMFTLVLIRIPTGLRAICEDLVVLASHRRRGIGEQLMRAALARARSAGARTVDFTSRPSRETANRLYLRLGFVVRDTQVYRYSPDLGGSEIS